MRRLLTITAGLPSAMAAVGNISQDSTASRFSSGGSSKSTAAHGPVKLAPNTFFQSLSARGWDMYYGVPDSLLKDLCAYITEKVPSTSHVITANEGNAVGMAAGYHLATGKVPIVYMQNSGYGNALNPLLSLTHQDVYRIPMLLVIGWRGDPEGKSDEPQHVAQGRLMTNCLAAAEIPFAVLEPKKGEKGEEMLQAAFQDAMEQASHHFKKHGTPFALLVKRDYFQAYKAAPPTESAEVVLRRTLLGGPRGDSFYERLIDAAAVKKTLLSREGAIEGVLNALGEDDVVVSTTGMPSREVFECRARAKAGHHRDFLTVGSMGHCASIAAGASLALSTTAAAATTTKRRNVIALDGDGAALMHLGAWPVLGNMMDASSSSPSASSSALQHFKHIVINNGAHDSVGGQPTVGWRVDFPTIAKASGYRHVAPTVIAESVEGVQRACEAFLRGDGGVSAGGPSFLEIMVKKGNRADLGRPTTTPVQNKTALMTFMGSHAPPSK